MSVITPEVTEVMKAQAPLDMTKAEAIAEQFGIKARAVIASAVRQGIPYQKKVRATKAGTPVVSKTDLVAKIALKLGVDVTDLAGLDKATKTALEVLAE